MTDSGSPAVAPALAPPSPALWNPNAAANWSLLFTPAFGSYLHMVNWRNLGKPDRAERSRRWFYIGIGMLVVYVLMALFIGDDKSSGIVIRATGFIFLLAWYFGSARTQAKYVKAQFGKAYVHRPWGKVLVLGIAGLCGYFVLAFITGIVVGLARYL